jgi:transposase-like protein
MHEDDREEQFLPHGYCPHCDEKRYLHEIPPTPRWMLARGIKPFFHCPFCNYKFPQEHLLKEPSGTPEWKPPALTIESFKRGLSGAAASSLKVNDAIVRSIRKDAMDGDTQKVIADRYGVNQGTVSRIISRTKWGHVKDIE